MTKNIAIFGSTGSIGINTVNIIKKSVNKFNVEVLLAHSNVDLLAEQAIELNPKYVGIIDETKLEKLRFLLKNTNIKIVYGDQAASELAKIQVDLSVMAIVGAAAILPTINAIKSGNNIALANKECLVCAGSIIMELVKTHKIKIIPVDSEHNGLFQVFDHKHPELVKNITLTASGGPFREYSIEQMQHVTKAQALKHPNWSMGAKISIDSATLINKCLEIIEAYHLFPVSAQQIKMVIHPESIMHALVTYQDGSMLAQLSKPNMQIPISYALYYPDRGVLEDFNQINMFEIGSLNFYEPDKNKFTSLKILDSILTSMEGNSALVFNIANEEAVSAFLNDKITFSQITTVIEEILSQIQSKQLNSINEIFEHIELVKQKTLAYINKISLI